MRAGSLHAGLHCSLGYAEEASRFFCAQTIDGGCQHDGLQIGVEFTKGTRQLAVGAARDELFFEGHGACGDRVGGDRYGPVLAQLIDETPDRYAPEPCRDRALPSVATWLVPDRDEGVLDRNVDNVLVRTTCLQASGEPRSVASIELFERAAIGPHNAGQQRFVLTSLFVHCLPVGSSQLAGSRLAQEFRIDFSYLPSFSLFPSASSERYREVGRTNYLGGFVNRLACRYRQMGMPHTITPNPLTPNPLTPNPTPNSAHGPGSGFTWDSVPPPPPLPGAIQTTPPPPPPPGPGPSKARERFGLVARFAFVAAGIAVSFQLDSGIFVAVAVLFVLVAPFEKLYPRQKGQKIRRPLAGSDVSFALMSPVLNVFGITAAVLIGGLSLFWLPGLAFRPVVAAIPPALLPVFAFFLFDFLGYWTHRWAHEVPFLWRFHAVHHSPEHMDWVSGFRIHPFDGVLIAPAFFFFLAAGFDVELTGFLAVFQIILGLFFHANVRVRWRWLDKVAANPEFHHWHHANETDAIGHNYAPALPWWDLAFGTFFMPHHTSGRRPQHYGIDEYLPTSLFGKLTYPCRGARKHLVLWHHPIRATKLAYRGARILVADLWRSARRPTRSVRRETTPGAFSTNASLGITERTSYRQAAWHKNGLGGLQISRTAYNSQPTTSSGSFTGKTSSVNHE